MFVTFRGFVVKNDKGFGAALRFVSLKNAWCTEKYFTKSQNSKNAHINNYLTALKGFYKSLRGGGIKMLLQKNTLGIWKTAKAGDA